MVIERLTTQKERHTHTHTLADIQEPKVIDKQIVPKNKTECNMRTSKIANDNVK